MTVLPPRIPRPTGQCRAPAPEIAPTGHDSAMSTLTILVVVALLAAVLIALTQRTWPVALLCIGLLMATLADAGLIVS